MKKLFGAIVVLVIGSSFIVQAQNSNQQEDVKGSKQAQNHFVTSLFQKEIHKPVSNQEIPTQQLDDRTNQSEQNLKQDQVEKLEKSMSKSNFFDDVIKELKEKGYKPTGAIAMELYSTQKKIITIFIKDFDNDDSKDIKKIVDQISSEKNLGAFVVKIHED